MNETIICGRLAKDPITRYTTGDEPLAVVSFTVALERGKKRNGEDAGVDYIPCKMFGKKAENFARFFGKGYGCLLRGHLQSGNYESKKTGEKVYTLDLVVDEWEFLPGNPHKTEEELAADKQNRAEVNTVNYTAYKMAQEENAVPEGFSKLDDDIPF